MYICSLPYVVSPWISGMLLKKFSDVCRENTKLTWTFLQNCHLDNTNIRQEYYLFLFSMTQCLIYNKNNPNLCRGLWLNRKSTCGWLNKPFFPSLFPIRRAHSRAGLVSLGPSCLWMWSVGSGPRARWDLCRIRSRISAMEAPWSPKNKLNVYLNTIYYSGPFGFGLWDSKGELTKIYCAYKIIWAVKKFNVQTRSFRRDMRKRFSNDFMCFNSCSQSMSFLPAGLQEITCFVCIYNIYIYMFWHVQGWMLKINQVRL